MIRAIAFNFFVDEKCINHSLPRLKRGRLWLKGKNSKSDYPDKIIAHSREEKGRSKTDFADNSSVSRVMISKYEWGEAVPSIKAAKKIIDAFEVSVDYLVGEGINAHFDKKTVQRLQDIESLAPHIKDKLFFLIDTVVRDNKARQAYI